MPKYLAKINIMPRPELLDPQGKTVKKAMPNIQVKGVEDVRIGKHVQIRIEADTEQKAREQIDEACSKLLANTIVEPYSFELEEA